MDFMHKLYAGLCESYIKYMHINAQHKYKYIFQNRKRHMFLWCI
jgi:hypothetical protein